MTDFLVEETSSGFLSEELPAKEPVEGKIVQSEKEQEAEVRGDPTRLANQLSVGGNKGVFQLMLDQGADLPVLQEAALKEEEIQKILTDVESITAVDAALAEDPLIGPTLLRINRRQERASRLLLNMAEEYEDGAVGKVLEFIDQISYDTWTGIVDTATDQTMLRGEGSEVTELSEMWADAMRTMDDEQFESFLNERMSALQSFGSSGNEASWRVLRELKAMESAGLVLWDKEMGVLYGAMSLLDTATLGLTGVVKAANVGRSVVGRLRRTAGTRVASEAATGTSVVARGGIDGEILDAQVVLEDLTSAVSGAGRTRRASTERPRTRISPDAEDAYIIEDIAPGMYSSRVGRTGNASPPPTAFGYIGRSLNENEFLRRYLLRAANKGFGATSITSKAIREASTLASKAADASATRAIDIDIEEVTPGVFKAKFALGKDDGSPFRSFSSAERVARDVPNAKIIDTRTNATVTGDTGSGQFAVKVEAPIPSRNLVTSLDLSEIGNRTFLGKFFGRADLKSSTFMSNLADASDAGAQGLAKDFQQSFKKLSGASRKEAQAIDTILTALRDTPTNGNARTWLTPDQFANQYHQLTGEWPSRNAIEAYQTAIQMSDFSWYTVASDRLRILFNQRATVIKADGKDMIAVPSRNKPATVDGAYVWDAAQDKAVKAATLPEDSVLYAFDRPRQLPIGATRKANISHVVNFRGNSRLPTLEDAFPYNAGGPRSNPEITWFVGTHDDGWSTLLGARSERDANLAAEEINALIRANNDGVLTDEIVAANNKWNPNIETVDELKEFARKRGIDLEKPVLPRRRDEKIQEGTAVADEYYVNMTYERFTTLHRHDVALTEYGGSKASNPDPISAVLDQFSRMTTRAASTQYRMQHPTAWVEAVNRAVQEGKLRVSNASLKGTDEVKVRNWVIEGESELARKLKSEQLVINRRLSSGSSLTEDFTEASFGTTLTAAAERMVETIHNISPKAAGPARWVSENFVKGGNNKLLSLGFFQNMASLDQVVVQTSHIIPISAASPVNGPKAVALATVARQAGRAGADNSVWKIIYRNMGTKLGLSPRDVEDLMEHLFFSGRGYMRGAIAEDPAAGILSRGVGSKVGKIVSSPYYAGENFSASVSRITAYLDTRKKFPTLDTKSDTFWNAVQKRDRDLSFALNRSQRSMVQDESFLRVITQWTSYPTRTIENLFNVSLTKGERARMLAASTILWGVSGASIYGAASFVRENFPGPIAEIIADGADYALSELIGIKPGRRLSLNPAELIERGVGTFTNPFETVPATRITKETALPAINAISNFASGRSALARHDVETLVRAWKIVDAPIMAYQMMMEDVRITNSGSVTRKDFTTSQEFLQAIGFTPAEAVEKFGYQRITWNAKKQRDDAIRKGTDIVKLAAQAFQQGDNDRGLQLMLDADAVVQAYGFNDIRLSEVRDAIFRNVGYDTINWTLENLIKDGYEEQARQWKEEVNG